MGIKHRATVRANARESMGATRLKAGGTAAVATAPPPPRPDPMKGVARIAGALRIPLDLLVADPDQPRKFFAEEDLARLAETLESRGQLQPIRVRRVEELGKWAIVDGERRFRAAAIAGLDHLEAVVDERDDALRKLDQLVANCCREGLRPVEQAEAFRELMAGQGWSGRELARRLGISQSSVSKSLSLLGLPEDVRDQVEAGELPASVACELAKVEDEGDQILLARMIIECDLGRSDALREIGQVIRGESPVALGDRPDPAPKVIHGESPRRPALPDWRDIPATAMGLDRHLTNLLVDTEIESAGEAWAMVEAGVLMEVHEWSWLEAKQLEQALVKIREDAGDPDPHAALMRPVVAAAAGPGPEADPVPEVSPGSRCEGEREAEGGPVEVFPAGPWESRRLADEPSCHSEAAKAAAAIGVETFGQLADRFAAGTTDATFAGFGGLLWSCLNRVKRVAPTVYRPVEGNGHAGDGRGVPGVRPAGPEIPRRKLIDLLAPTAWRKQQFADRDEAALAEVDGLEAVVRSDRGERPDVELLEVLRRAVAALEARLGV